MKRFVSNRIWLGVPLLAALQVSVAAQQPLRPACEQFKMRVVTPGDQLDKQMEIAPQTNADYKGVVITPCQPAVSQAAAPGSLITTGAQKPLRFVASPKQSPSNKLFNPGDMFRRAQQNMDKP